MTLKPRRARAVPILAASLAALGIAGAYPYVELLADHGLAEACRRQPALIGGVNVYDGKLTCKAVAEALANKPPKKRLVTR